MKITWFGGTALRIHIGGKILLCDPDRAGPGIDRTELVSGADRVFELTATSAQIDPLQWAPRRPRALVDTGEPDDVLVHHVGGSAVLVDAVGEPPLLVSGSAMMLAGRWAREAVVVVFDGFSATHALLELSPRLIALAETGIPLEAAIESLRDRLAGTALMALEKGLALEI